MFELHQLLESHCSAVCVHMCFGLSVGAVYPLCVWKILPHCIGGTSVLLCCMHRLPNRKRYLLTSSNTWNEKANPEHDHCYRNIDLNMHNSWVQFSFFVDTPRCIAGNCRDLLKKRKNTFLDNQFFLWCQSTCHLAEKGKKSSGYCILTVVEKFWTGSI